MKPATTKASNFAWKKGYKILILVSKGNTKSPEVLSHSVHYIAHEGFREAIGNFCTEEAEAVRGYHQDNHALLPFKQDAADKNG